MSRSTVPLSQHEPTSQIRLHSTAILALLALSLLACKILVQLFHPGSLRHIPGPWLNKLSGVYLAYFDLTYSRNRKIAEWHHTYGPVICIGPKEISVATLEGTKLIHGATQGWAKSDYVDHFVAYNTPSLFTTKPHVDHREKRKLTSNIYQTSCIYNLPELEQFILSRCQTVVGHLGLGPPGQDVDADVYSLTNRYALDIISYFAFGPNHSTRSIERECPERDMLRDLNKLQFAGPIRVQFPAIYSCLSGVLGKLGFMKFLSADQRLEDWCQRRLLDARDDPLLLSSRSLLRELLGTREHGERKFLDNGFIAAELLDNISAGEVTIAVTATYLIWLLSDSRLWQRRIREEIHALPVQCNGFPSFQDINNHVPSLEACLLEAYRLYPVTSGRSERIVPKGGCTISGFHLPEGTIASSSAQCLHRQETYFPDPEAFSPNRWLEGDEEQLKRRAAQLIPFGYGARICLGKALANMEIKMLIAAIYLRCETFRTPRSTAESMAQSSTHDAVPRGLECVIRFQSCA